jgi:hypothetical protein
MALAGMQDRAPMTAGPTLMMVGRTLIVGQAWMIRRLMMADRALMIRPLAMGVVGTMEILLER